MNEESALHRTPSLVKDILVHLSNLVRKELDLARSEVDENLGRAAVGIGLIVVAAILAFTAIDILSAALVAALVATGLIPGNAALLVGGALALIAIGLAAKGIHDIRLSSIAPGRAAEKVRRDAGLIKEKLND